MYRRAVEHTWGDLAESEHEKRAAVDRTAGDDRVPETGEQRTAGADRS